MSDPSISIKATDRVMIIGTTGTGKSNFVNHIIRLYRDILPILLYDDEDEHEYLDETDSFLQVDKHKSYRYIPKFLTEDERKTEFNQICGEVYRRKNVIFVIENIDLYATVRKPLPDNFFLVVKKGRKRGIGVIMTSQRIADVHKFPCSQSKQWFIYRTHLPNEVKYMRQFIGDNADKTRLLKEYHFLYWTQGQLDATPYTPIPLEA